MLKLLKNIFSRKHVHQWVALIVKTEVYSREYQTNEKHSTYTHAVICPDCRKVEYLN